jgi:hypothetical protein
MKKLAVVALLLPLLSIVSGATTTWIGTVTGQHCGPNFTAIRGDDEACIVFIANDQQVYKVPEQERIKPFIGTEVTIVGALTEELTINVTYETQGIIKIDSIGAVTPLDLTSQQIETYQGWMSSLQPQVGAVRKAIGTKDSAMVTSEAEKLAAVFDQVTAFWQQHQNPDALHFAMAAADSAKSIGRAPTQVDQIIALQKVQNAYASCHLGHRSARRDTIRSRSRKA